MFFISCKDNISVPPDCVNALTEINNNLNYYSGNVISDAMDIFSSVFSTVPGILLEAGTQVLASIYIEHGTCL